MIPAPPPDTPVVWPCVVRVDESGLAARDRPLMRKARKRVRGLTGIRFRLAPGTNNGIEVSYNHSANFAIAQTAVQSKRGKIIYAGVQLYPQYRTVRAPGKVLKHELLHAVGVPHSPNPRSLMYHQHLPRQKVDPRLRRTVRLQYRHCLGG